MSSKISALTDGTTAQAADRLPVSRGGANRFITPAYIAAYTASVYGLLAQAVTTSDVDYTAGDHRIDFDDVLRDPGSIITTGASWKVTIPATGSYMFVLELASVADLGSDWAAGDAINVYLYKGVSTFLGVLGARTFDVLTPDGQADANMAGTCVPTTLTAADQVWAQFRNLTASTRRLYAGAKLSVLRVG